MNKLNQRMICSSIVFVFSAFVAQADPLRGPYDTRFNHPMVSSSEPLSEVTDVNQGGLGNSGETSQHATLELALITPANGKVLSVERAQGGTRVEIESSAEQLVADASEAVGATIDPSSISIATTASSVGTQVTSGNDFTPSPVTGGPEPSTLFLAGSMLVGFSVFQFSRSKSR
jgi:hypothetical protein